MAGDPSWAALLRHAVAHGAYAGCALPPGFEAQAGAGGARAAQALHGGSPVGGRALSAAWGDEGEEGEEGEGLLRVLRRANDEAQSRAAAEGEGRAGGGGGAEVRTLEEGPEWPGER